MKYVFLIVTLFLSIGVSGQEAESAMVKQTILDFFEAFHKQDSTGLKETVRQGIIMQSMGKDDMGNSRLNSADFNNFVKSIVSIPKERSFEEKLLGFNIQVDGIMANAWTPYEFWFDGKFSHCGVNSFQLMKENDKWKIIYLVDTRRKEGCAKP